MLARLFNPDNLLFRGCAKIFDLALLSLLWVALCLPVITAGPATAALYYATVKCVRRGEPEPYGNFFRSFRENFKVGAAAGMLFTLAGLVLWFCWLILSSASAGDTAAALLRAAYAVALVLPLGAGCYAFPLLSRFSLGLGGLLAASLKLAIRHLPSTVIVVLMTLQAVGLCMRHWYPVVLAPACTALLASLFLERIFRQYTPAPQEAPPMGEGAEDLDQTPWYLK